MTNEENQPTRKWSATPFMAGFVLLAFVPVLSQPLVRETRRWQAAGAALQLKKLIASDDATVGDAQKPIEALEEHYRQDPTDFSIGALLAKSYSQVGRHEESIALYDEMISSIEEYYEPDAEENEAAESLAEKVAKFGASVPTVWWRFVELRSREHHATGQFEKVIELSNLQIKPFEKTVEAIADKNQYEVTKIARATYYRMLSQLYNQRAYNRALAGVELDDAIAEMDQALQLNHRANQLYEFPAQEGEWKFSDEGQLRDTRGFALYQRDAEGDAEKALSDLNIAIELLEEDNLTWEDFFPRFRAHVATLPELEAKYLRSKILFAVIYYHRGLAHERLGDTAKAEADFQKVRELGYKPSEDLY